MKVTSTLSVEPSWASAILAVSATTPEPSPPSSTAGAVKSIVNVSTVGSPSDGLPEASVWVAVTVTTPSPNAAAWSSVRTTSTGPSAPVPVIVTVAA